MKITKYHWLAGLIVLVVIVGAAFLGIYIGTKNLGYRTIAEGIIIPDKDKDYESVLITSYTAYTDLLRKLGIAKDVFLTAGDLDKNDYIIDYIYYEDGMKVEDIYLDITDDGVNIKYVVNKEINNSDEILIYFIPLEKGTLSDYTFAGREFEVK